MRPPSLLLLAALLIAILAMILLPPRTVTAAPVSPLDVSAHADRLRAGSLL
ncbi:MAG TPA: hypothetical protein VME66_07620 [Candidatus Acidoferrales bacterium]|nr:hypothetical protein [Candidatus Acidoferrales bacterium]